MYLRPDEVARVLEKAGFIVDVVTNKTYGYRRGENYVYVNREARMGRTALIIHPRLKDRSSSLAEPASDMKTCDHYQNFPLYLGGETHEHYGIPHGFSFTNGVRTLFDRAVRRCKTGLTARLALPVAKQAYALA
ncbi:YgaC [Salmonella bongori]|nr:YgaC [Salmonella bongori]